MPEYLAALKAQHSTVHERTRSVTPEAARAATKAGYYGPVSRVADLSEADFNEHMWTAWRIGGTGILRGISDLYVSEKANARVAEFCRQRVKERVSDPAIAELLCAKGHFVGAKRILCEDGYFETYNKDNVSLVDLRSTPIRRVVPSGIETTAETYQIDVIIAATGFDSGTGALTGIDIVGRDGAKLSDKWEWGPSTYLGIMVSNFPNLFILSGPGSPSIRSNGFLAAEQHAEWLTELVLFMRWSGFDVVEPTPEAEEAWTTHVASVADGTLLTRDDTQYVGANVPGKPRVFLAYAGGLVIYRMVCDSVTERGYQGFAFGAASGGDTVLPGGAEWTGPPVNPKLRTRFGNPII
jgi:cation diffusion facilitator CzcD-associated flavoprotein CzcO